MTKPQRQKRERWTDPQETNSDELLDSARRVMLAEPKPFTVKPWREIMATNNTSLAAAAAKAETALKANLVKRLDAEITAATNLKAEIMSAPAALTARQFLAEGKAPAASVFATAADQLTKGVDKQAKPVVKSGGPSTKAAKPAKMKATTMARKPSTKTTTPSNGTKDQPLPDTVDDSNETHTDRVNDSDHADETRLPPADDVNPDGQEGQDSANKQTKQERDAAAARKKTDDKAARSASIKKQREQKALDKENAKAQAAADRAAKREERAAAQKYDDNGQPIFDPVMHALRAKVAAGLYVKGATGQYRSNNDLALALDRVQPGNVVKMARALLGDAENRYAHMNMGQQSMNYRNRLRGAIKADKLTLADVVKYITDHNMMISEADKAVPTGNHPVGAPANPEQDLPGGTTGLEIPTHTASGEVGDNAQEAVDASIGAREEQTE